MFVDTLPTSCLSTEPFPVTIKTSAESTLSAAVSTTPATPGLRGHTRCQALSRRFVRLMLTVYLCAGAYSVDWLGNCRDGTLALTSFCTNRSMYQPQAKASIKGSFSGHKALHAVIGAQEASKSAAKVWAAAQADGEFTASPSSDTPLIRCQQREAKRKRVRACVASSDTMQTVIHLCLLRSLFGYSWDHAHNGVGFGNSNDLDDELAHSGLTPASANHSFALLVAKSVNKWGREEKNPGELACSREKIVALGGAEGDAALTLYHAAPPCVGLTPYPLPFGLKQFVRFARNC